MKRAFAVLAILLLATPAWANDPPRLKRYPELFGLGGSTAPDTTSLGTVSGTTVAFTDLDCTTFTNGGALTTDAAGNFECSNDDTGGTSAPADATYLTLSNDATLTVERVLTEGLAVDFADTGANGTLTVALDPTELTGSRTWGDASTDTIVWTWNRATGTDPTLTFGSNIVTGPTVVSTVGFVVPDNGYVGLDADAGRLEFDDQTLDEVNILSARVGIGTATPSNTVQVQDAGTDAAADALGVFIESTATYGTDGARAVRALQAVAMSNGAANNTNEQIAIVASNEFVGTGTLDWLIGLDNFVTVDGTTGDVTEAYNIWNRLTDGGAGSVIDTAYGMYTALNTANAGTVNTYYGVYLDLTGGTGATTNWGFYEEAAFNNFLEGSLQLGTNGVVLSDDADGALEILGASTGNDECLNLNFDDTANTVVFANCAVSSGVTTLALTGMDFVLSATIPTLEWEDTTTGHLDAHAYLEGGLLTFAARDTTTPPEVLELDFVNRKLRVPNLTSCDSVDTDADGWLKCGTDATGAGGGDAITVATTAATDPDFIDSSRIDVTLDTGASPDTITWDVVADSIDGSQLADTITTDANLTISGNRLIVSGSPSTLQFGDGVHFYSAADTLTLAETNTSGSETMIWDTVNRRVYTPGTICATGQVVTTFPDGLVRCVNDDVDIQVFTTPGAATWTKPTGAQWVRVMLIGGGGGGGSGRRGAAGTTRNSGGGGEGGFGADYGFDADLLSATETVTVGAGGSGGGAATSDSSDGNAGTAGVQTSFGSWLFAGGGEGGGAGTTGTAAGGTSFATFKAGAYIGGTGGDSTNSGATGEVGNADWNQNGAIMGHGGGAGGGLTSGNAETGGAAGGGSGVAGAEVQYVGATLPAAGTAGASGGGAGGAGGNVTANLPFGGGGGGGGGSESDGVGTGGTGGAGGLYGGGGGAGGASANGANSGAGGDGASGIAIIITYF